MEQVEITKSNTKELDKISTLTERDWQIMEYLASHGFMGASEIGKKFWGNLSTKIHHRRLRVIEKYGLIENMTIQHNQLVGYRLTKKGLAWLNQKHQEQKFFYRPALRSSQQHDQKLNQVEQILLKSAVVSNFLPEHQLRVVLTRKYGGEEKRDRGFKVPDALFKLNTINGPIPVALELELSHKSEARYMKILKQLSISKDFTAVFYLCANEPLIEKIRRVLKKLRSTDLLVMGWKVPHGFYFCPIDEFLNKGTDAKFYGEESEFTLNSLAQKMAAFHEKLAT